MDVQELLEQYAARKRNFIWADLQGADLTGVELPQINLSRANLSGAIAVGTNLSGANLIKADLSGANLQDANLARSRLYKANFRAANLDRANFIGANLTGVNLEGASLQGAIMPDGTDYEQWLANLKPPESEIETIALVEEEEAAAPIVLAAEEAQRHRVQAKLLDRLPKIPLFFLGLGYFLFGLLLAFGEAIAPLMFIAWAGSLIWTIDESLIWFVPITAAIAVVLSVNLTIFTLILTGVVALMAIAGMAAIGFGWKKTLKDGLFLSAIAAIAFAILQWCLFESDFQVAFTLILAMVAAGFGSLSAPHMLEERFSFRQTWQTFACTAGLGLMGGCLAGLLL